MLEPQGHAVGHRFRKVLAISGTSSRPHQTQLPASEDQP